jgi:probable phosphoglycerate mutase
LIYLKPLTRKENARSHPIIIVRHGEAEHLISDITGGWSDTHLTEYGHKQAQATAKSLKTLVKNRNVKVFSSDLIRAIDTAKYFTNLMGLEIEKRRELREMNNGVAAGKRKEEIKHLFNVSSEFSNDWRPYPGAESWGEFYTRVSNYLDTYFKKRNETRVIFTHGGTLHMIVSWWLGLDSEQMGSVRFRSAPCGITVLYESMHDEKTIDRLSDTSHLNDIGYHNALPY